MIDLFLDPSFRASTLGTIFMCIAAALIGVLSFVKRRSLIGETLSHATYPGVILAALIAAPFCAVGDAPSTFILLAVASLCALAGALSIRLLEKKLRLHADAALCFVLASFLGLGVLLASRIQFTHPVWYKYTQTFLYGQAATILNHQVWLYCAFTVALLLFILVNFRTLQKLKRSFPAERGESLSSYFQRLADWISIELQGGRARE